MQSKCENLIVEIKNRKKILENEKQIIQNKKNDNKFLEQVYSDYKKYYLVIKNEKQKQLDAFLKISYYLDSLIDESKVAKETLQEIKNDKYKILGKIEEIRSEINSLTQD